MKPLIVIDTNILLRFLLADDPNLFKKAKSIFDKAEKGKQDIYLDELIVAEAIWVLASFYKKDRGEISEQIIKLVGQSWIINSRKEMILQTLEVFRTTSLHYIDCWIYMISMSLKSPLGTFDKTLKRLDLDRV